MRTHINFLFSIAIAASFSMFLSCSDSSSSEKISADAIWLDSTEVDAITGSTMLGDLADMGDLTNMVWTSPHSKLIAFLTAKQFVTDTSRLNQLASYAYKDLRQSSFSSWNKELINRLDKETHTMGESSALTRGYGYYYTKVDSTGNFTGTDIGFEVWKIDTIDSRNVELLIHEWKEKYHPMPFYTVVHGDKLYALYTRSLQFDSFLKSCVREIR